MGLRQADYRGILSFLGDLGTANDLDGFMTTIGREFESKATLPSRAGACRAFVLSRDGRDFSDRETLILEALLPHLAHAFRNVRDREVTNAIAATLGDVAGVRGLGIVVLGPSERIEAFAGRGQELLESYVGRENGHLPEAVASWVRYQHRRMASPEVGLPPEPFVVEGPERHLTIQLVSAGRRPPLLLEEHRIPPPDPDPDFRLTPPQ